MYDPTLMRGRGDRKEMNNEYLRGFLLVSDAKMPFMYSQVDGRKFTKLASSFPIDDIAVGEVIYTSRIDLPFATDRPVELHDGQKVLINIAVPNKNEYGRTLGWFLHLGDSNA